VWFTDPPFGIQGYGPRTAEEEQPVRGIYRFKDGTLALMDGSRKLPNGIAFSSDGHWLYVADTANGTVYRYGVGAGGRLAAPKAFARIPPAPGQEPMVDGIRVDRWGRLWMTGPASLGVFSAAGQPLCRLPIPGGHVSNLAFGGHDGRDILLTVREQVMALRARQRLL
jgi:gluconolactonase